MGSIGQGGSKWPKMADVQSIYQALGGLDTPFLWAEEGAKLKGYILVVSKFSGGRYLIVLGSTIV